MRNDDIGVDKLPPPEGEQSVAKVTMPQLGESVAEGTIGKWLKKPGDSVAKDEPLLEVITDKVNAEVPSPFAGILRAILVEEGATVPNHAEIAVIQTAEEGDTQAGSTAPDTTAAAAVAASGAASPGTTGTATTTSAASALSAVPAPAALTTRVVKAPIPAMPAAALAMGGAVGLATPLSTGPSTTPVGSVAQAVGVAPVAPADGDGEARMTPAVRRLLREHGLSASQIVGTGGGGRITREDVSNYVESARTGQPFNGQTAAASSGSGAANGSAQVAAVAPAQAAASLPAAGHAAASAPAPMSAGSAPSGSAPSGRGISGRGISGQQVTFPEGADEVLVPMTLMRRGIAQQMTRALQVPHAYVQVEVDATRLVKLRDRHKRAFQAQEGSSLSFVPFIVKAVVNALRRNPAFNAHWTDRGLLAKRRINVGVAVAVPDGLIVPVVHDVDQLSIAGINRAIAEVAARARANKLRLEDIQGSTFTVDNTGWFGSNITLPIINVPEVAILTMENITKRAVVLETEEGDVIAIRPVMNMVLGIDHRANDGAQAAAFLSDVKAWLENLDTDLPLW